MLWRHFSQSYNSLYESVLVPLSKMCKRSYLFAIDNTHKKLRQAVGGPWPMFLLHCFDFKRPDEPWRGRGPHDPTLFRPVTPLKALSPTLKTYTFILENVFFTKSQTCKGIPECERKLNLLPNLSLCHDVALNRSMRSMMKMKPVDCRGMAFTNVSGIKLRLATFQTSL